VKAITVDISPGTGKIQERSNQRQSFGRLESGQQQPGFELRELLPATVVAPKG
jgi:hypothetical protein